MVGAIKHRWSPPEMKFQAHLLVPGDALFFSGSSQWQYRDRHPGGEGAFCNLILFHFAPRGAKDLIATFPAF